MNALGYSNKEDAVLQAMVETVTAAATTDAKVRCLAQGRRWKDIGELEQLVLIREAARTIFHRLLSK